MNLNSYHAARNVGWIAAGLLGVALLAPCAIPNRIVAGSSLVLGLFSMLSIFFSGYFMIRRNRQEWEKEAQKIARGAERQV